ncbi:MAG TPA: antifreeze protein [Xanthobacteraceae bacterium]|jgi:hypothetical protein|nr:antifreeze protein [Xanthobacteraceae bacterium]
MLARYTVVFSVTVLSVISLQGTSAHALSLHECSVKYQAAKNAGTLNGLKWNDFRKTQCGGEATAAPAPSPVAAPLPTPTAHGLSMRECSAKYQAAKTAGTLNGVKWNDFRKTQCGGEATAAPAPATAAAPASAPTPAPSPATAPTRSAAPVTIGNAVFPSAINPKYSSQSAGKARMETCLDQYRINKANNANGGLKWIQRGGGYYSECNKHLKGQA